MVLSGQFHNLLCERTRSTGTSLPTSREYIAASLQTGSENVSLETLDGFLRSRN